MDRSLTRALQHTARHALALLGATLLLAPGPIAQGSSGERVALPGGAASTQLSASADGQSMLVYDVGDLTDSVQGAILSVEAISYEDLVLADKRIAELADMEARRLKALAALESLEDVVWLSMEPPLIDGRDDLRRLGDNLLVLNASAAHHAWMTQFLETQRSADGLIHMKAIVWTGPHGSARELQLGLQGETQRMLETREEVEGAIALADSLGFSRLTSPELATYPRQHGTVSVLNQTSYVSEWKLVHVAPDQRPVADPVIEVVKEGLEFSARAVPLAPGHWSVEADFLVSHLERPIATRTVFFGDGSLQGEISLPIVTKVGMSSRFSVGAGGGALFLTYDQMANRDTLVLLQVDDLEALEAAPRK